MAGGFLPAKVPSQRPFFKATLKRQEASDRNLELLPQPAGKDSVPGMKKVCAKVLAGCAMVAAVLILFLCIEHSRGTRALNSRLKELKAKGEKLGIAELLPAPVPAEQNAALDLFALTNEFKEFRKMSEQAPPRMRMVTPGHAVASGQWNTWPVSETESNSWIKFSAEIEPAKIPLARLESILRKNGFDEGFDYNKTFIDFQSPKLLAFIKPAALLLAAAIADDLHRHDASGAAAHLHSLAALVKAQEGEKLILSQLVRIVCARIVFASTWEALQTDELSPAQLASLQADWEASEFPQAMLAALEMERAMTLRYFNEVRSSPAKRARVFQEKEEVQKNYGAAFGPPLPTHGFILHHIHIPIWRFAWAGQEESNALDEWDHVIEGSRTAVSKSWLEARPFMAKGISNEIPILIDRDSSDDKRGWYDRFRFILSPNPFSIAETVTLKALEAETEKNLVVTAIALKRHGKSNKPPAELSALVPEFLPAIPIDRMDGKPLRYRLNGDGSFLLYSVGTDGKDDGGNPQPVDSAESASKIWNGKDVVWPVLATEAEAGEAFKQGFKIR